MQKLYSIKEERLEHQEFEEDNQGGSRVDREVEQKEIELVQVNVSQGGQ